MESNESSPKSSRSEVNRILSNLILISKIPIRSKLAIRNNQIIIHCSTSWSDWIARNYNGDNRQNTLSYLENLGNDVEQILKTNKDDSMLCKRITTLLDECRSGLNNLNNEYYADVNFNSKLQTIIDNYELMKNTYSS